MENSNYKFKISRSVLIICLVFVCCINNFASIVSDSDGSAFVTKKEFERLKNSFENQITNYNLSIDNKIDGVIASYLSGMTLVKDEKKNFYDGSGKTVVFAYLPSMENFKVYDCNGKISGVLSKPASSGTYCTTTAIFESTRNATTHSGEELYHKNEYVDVYSDATDSYGNFTVSITDIYCDSWNTYSPPSTLYVRWGGEEYGASNISPYDLSDPRSLEMHCSGMNCGSRMKSYYANYNVNNVPGGNVSHSASIGRTWGAETYDYFLVDGANDIITVPELTSNNQYWRQYDDSANGWTSTTYLTPADAGFDKHKWSRQGTPANISQTNPWTLNDSGTSNYWTAYGTWNSIGDSTVTSCEFRWPTCTYERKKLSDLKNHLFNDIEERMGMTVGSGVSVYAGLPIDFFEKKGVCEFDIDTTGLDKDIYIALSSSPFTSSKKINESVAIENFSYSVNGVEKTVNYMKLSKDSSYKYSIKIQKERIPIYIKVGWDPSQNVVKRGKLTFPKEYFWTVSS